MFANGFGLRPSLVTLLALDFSTRDFIQSAAGLGKASSVRGRRLSPTAENEKSRNPRKTQGSNRT